jgi:hypothetical protein
MNRFDIDMATLIQADRERELERRARVQRLAPAPIGRDPIRRRLGRQLVRIGTTLADDPSLKPHGVVRSGAQRP